MPLIVSLSTIPPRFQDIGAALKSILDQSVAIDAIEVNIPTSYRRFPGELPSLPNVPDGVTIRRVDMDYGPATKVLPTVAAYRGQDCDILFCDDDRRFDKDWASRFVAMRKKRTDECIVEVGWQLGRLAGLDYEATAQPRARMTAHKKNLAYRLKRLISLGKYRVPHVKYTSGYVDLIGGYGGVLVKPSFFPDAAFDIPPVCWSVDDVWLSGMMKLNGTNIWLNASGIDAGVTEAERKSDLFHAVIDGHDRNSANAACVKHFVATYGIWN